MSISTITNIDPAVSTHQKIKAALILRGIEVQRIAADLGYSPSLITQVITGKRKNIRVAQYINSLLGSDLLPAEDQCGQRPNHRHGSFDPLAAPHAGHSQSGRFYPGC